MCSRTKNSWNASPDIEDFFFMSSYFVTTTVESSMLAVLLSFCAATVLLSKEKIVFEKNSDATESSKTYKIILLKLGFYWKLLQFCYQKERKLIATQSSLMRAKGSATARILLTKHTRTLFCEIRARLCCDGRAKYSVEIPFPYSRNLFLKSLGLVLGKDRYILGILFKKRKVIKNL